MAVYDFIFEDLPFMPYPGLAIWTNEETAEDDVCDVCVESATWMCQGSYLCVRSITDRNLSPDEFSEVMVDFLKNGWALTYEVKPPAAPIRPLSPTR